MKENDIKNKIDEILSNNIDIDYFEPEYEGEDERPIEVFNKEKAILDLMEFIKQII